MSNSFQLILRRKYVPRHETAINFSPSDANTSIFAYLANHVAVREHVDRHRCRVLRFLAFLQLLVLSPEIVHVRHVEPCRDACDNSVSVRTRRTEDCCHTLLQKLTGCNVKACYLGLSGSPNCIL